MLRRAIMFTRSSPARLFFAGPSHIFVVVLGRRRVRWRLVPIEPPEGIITQRGALGKTFQGWQSLVPQRISDLHVVKQRRRHGSSTGSLVSCVVVWQAVVAGESLCKMPQSPEVCAPVGTSFNRKSTATFLGPSALLSQAFLAFGWEVARADVDLLLQSLRVVLNR